MVNIYKLKLTNLQQEILRLFFKKNGKSLNARMVAKNLGVSSPAVLKALPLLHKHGLLKLVRDKESKRLSIELEKDNHQISWMKRIDNLAQIYESGLVQFFYDTLPETTIILFGSYALGEDTTSSDIDIAVIGTHYSHIDLNEYEKKLEREIIINYYGSFKDIDRHLLNNILNGITLKGTVEL